MYVHFGSGSKNWVLSDFSVISAQSEGKSKGPGPFDVLKDFRWL